MKRRKKKRVQQMQLANEEVAMIEVNPIAAGERLRVKLAMRTDEAIQDACNAVGDAAITGALLKALKAWRVLYGFSHALSEATNRGVYEIRWVLHEKLPTDFLKKRLLGLRHAGGLAPTVELPELGLKILKAIEAQQQPKPDEFQRYVESSPEVDYQQPSPRSYPSID